ncbi:cytochrome P450 [Nocardia sp. NPDC057272]|uniref:cytochrome P450 n=1 Tax=Nocardia sp. NPDC057272 TaxID=3346079 RepID=UPI00362AFA56
MTTTPNPGIFASLLDPAQRADPYPLYAQIREQGPIRLGNAPVVVLSSYRDCAAVLRDRAASVERHHASIPMGPTPVHDLAGTLSSELSGTASMLFRDPPDHTRLRRLVAKAFTPTVVRGLEPRITAITDAALDRAAERGELDLVQDLAYPLPITVICELLGVPLRDEPQLRRWSTLLARALDPVSATTAGRTEATTLVRANNELHEYFEQLVRHRRTRPSNDLLSALIAAEESTDTLTHDELLSTCALLLIAGHETTVNLIANTALALLRPGQRHQLADLGTAPAFTGAVIEESLRYDPPVQLVPRIARDAITLPNIDIAAGDLIVMLIAAANRDPDVFTDPDRYDPARGDRHLAFGLGQHFCLGAPLARLEATVALTRFARRVRDPRLACDQIAYREHVTLRGPARLPLTFSSIAPATRPDGHAEPAL